MELKNKNILITGGNRGIGWALAVELAKHGANIFIASRKIDSAQIKNLIELGAPHAEHIYLDLSTKDEINDFIQKIQEKKFCPDILVNNAGQLTGGLLEEQKINDIYSMFQVNIVGLVHLTHALLPGMIARGSGKIINNSSVSGVMHFPCASTYTAAKTAVVAFTQSLRQELETTGVSTLLLLTPGVKTRMFDEISALYSKNMDLSFLEGTISPECWASRICEAIKDDIEILNPPGFTGVSLSVAKYFPKIFERAVKGKFSRSKF